MPETVSCECGAKIRVPEDANGRSIRCPRCKATLATAPAAPSMANLVSASVSSGSDGASCPICQTTIVAGDLVLPCPECQQVHHRECWTEVGGCGTYGCKHAPALAKETPADDTPRAAWGDTKKCPACGETIKAIALKCRYCSTDFDTVDPLSVHDLHDSASKSEAQTKSRTTVSVLFGLTVIIGCAAPLMLILNSVWVLTNRKVLAKAGPVYLILGYAAIIVSVVYSLLILAFYLFSLFSET